MCLLTHLTWFTLAGCIYLFSRVYSVIHLTLFTSITSLPNEVLSQLETYSYVNHLLQALWVHITRATSKCFHGDTHVPGYKVVIVNIQDEVCYYGPNSMIM